MKKIITITLLMLSFAGAALADQFLVAAGTPVYGGADAASVGTNPLARFSTNVIGVVNYATPVAKTSASYALITKHTSGSKMFGTSNDATNIYWKALAGGTALTTALAGTGVTVANFSTVGSGWTSY